MTNAAIIMTQMELLIADGVLTEDNEIHTYAHWKSLGFQVKKGEKAVAKFPIWKYTKGKKKDMSEEEAQAKGYCFMKNAAWFSDEQVELPGNKSNSHVELLNDGEEDADGEIHFRIRKDA